MRLIDADAFKKMLAEEEIEFPMIDEQPTVDAIRVIRCKDCKYYSYGTVEGKHLCMSVKYRFTPTTEDEWCSRAERKEE